MKTNASSESGCRDRYKDLSISFDEIASSYDDETCQNPIFQSMRKTNLEYLMGTIQRGDRVLEIGCGTGQEAIALAKSGVRVVATDVSPLMLEETRKKADLQGVGLETFNLPAGGLSELEETYGRDHFDCVYSSFGALNCEPDLGIVDAQLARLLKPDGVLVASVMNKYALFEIISNLALLRTGKAFQRMSSPVSAPIGKGMKVEVRYYTPRGFASCFRHFEVEDSRALGIFMPPPYADDIVRGRKRLLRTLNGIDEGICRIWPFNGLGDHTLIKMRKVHSGK